MKKIRIGGLISDKGSNIKAIINACEKGQIDGDVVFVGSDNPEAEGLSWVRDRNIPTFAVDFSKIFQKINE